MYNTFCKESKNKYQFALITSKKFNGVNSISNFLKFLAMKFLSKSKLLII